jgi:hemoglobin
VSDPVPDPMSDDDRPLYERVGGVTFFETLVDRFYDGVAADDVLGPMYPEFPDLLPAKARLTLFLVQYWGGPTTYSEHRGHPRLRMRHAPYRVDDDARGRWLRHMHAAITAAQTEGRLGERERSELVAYVEMAASAMVNTPG